MSTEDDADSVLRAVAAAPAIAPPSRTVTALLVRAAGGAALDVPALRAAVEPFDGEAAEPADGTLVFSWTGATSQPTDRAASCALALRDRFAWTRLALASVSGPPIGKLAHGSFIGRAAELLDDAPDAIRLDAATASLLAGRFQIGSDRAGPVLLGSAIAATMPQADSTHLDIDSTVGNYRIDRKLGAGGMGVVYLAEHVALGRKAVVKFVHPELSRNDDLVRRFFTEAKTAASIRHPGIVDVFDYGKDSHGNSYIVMELLEGESLRELLARERTLRIEIAVALGVQIARAVGAAHERGVVHRDLKPDNVFVVRDPQLAHGKRTKVLDFGLAKATTVEGDVALTRSGALLGTPLYMSPEQCRTAVAVDHRTDIYSLGCVVFEMLAGRPPFVDTTVGDLIAAHIANPPPRLRASHPEIPPALDDAIARALAKRPADRQQSMEELAAELESAASAPVRGRRRWPVLLAPIAGALAVWLLRSDPAPRVRTVQLSAHAAQAEDAWMAVATDRMLRRQLEDLDRRTFALVDDQADLVIDLVVRRSAGGVAIDVGGVAVAQVAAPSVAEALVKLVPPLATAIGGELEPGPTERERADMERLGTWSFPAYRAYRRAVLEFARAIWIDSRDVAELARKAAVLDPTWAHPRVLLVETLGVTTADAGRELELAQRVSDGARDPAGVAILNGLERARSSDYPGAAKLIDPWFTRLRDDLILGATLQQMRRYGSEYDDSIAVVRELHRRWPELQFGGDLIHDLKIVGRAAEADREVHRWVVETPSSEQAWIELVNAEVEAGRGDESERAARRLLLLYGESTERLITLCDALILAGKLEQAIELAERMRRGGALARARARYRLGVIAVLQGRLGPAYETLLTARDENRPFGTESELTQILVLLRGLAPLVGDASSIRTTSQELVDTYANLGFVGNRAVAAYQLGLVDRGATCPDRTRALDSVPAGAARIVAQRHIIRAAAGAGCATCAEVIREGLTSDEYSTASLLALGICARAAGELALAKQTLERATRLPFGVFAGEASPYHALLARFHLAGVLASTGDSAGARREYTTFLAAWGNADRPLPEVAEARRELAKLPP